MNNAKQSIGSNLESVQRNSHYLIHIEVRGEACRPRAEFEPGLSVLRAYKNKIICSLCNRVQEIKLNFTD